MRARRRELGRTGKWLRVARSRGAGRPGRRGVPSSEATSGGACGARFAGAGTVWGVTLPQPIVAPECPRVARVKKPSLALPRELRCSGPLMITAYWLVQAVACFFGCRMLFFGSAGAEVLSSSEYLWQAGTLTASVMILQTAFVLPVRQSAGGGHGVWQRRRVACIGGLAVGLTVGFLAWLATTAARAWFDLNVDLAVPGLPGGQVWHLGFWIPFLLASLVAVHALTSRVRRGMPVSISAMIAALIAAVMVLAAVLFASDIGEVFRWWAFILFPFLGWIIAMPLFLVLLRRMPPAAALSRIASGLFLAVFLEADLIVALAIMGPHWGWTGGTGVGTVLAFTALGCIGPLILGPVVYLRLMAADS